VIAVRDVPLRREDRRELVAGEHLLQVFQHARIGQRQRVAPGGPQDVVGPPRDDREPLQLRGHLLRPALAEADAEVTGRGDVVVRGHIRLPLQVLDDLGSAHVSTVKCLR
jgi:hypothetical protein